MENVCFCCIPQHQRPFVIKQAKLFQIFCKEGADLYQTVKMTYADLEMLLNFFRCNGPYLTRYKRKCRS